MPDVIDSDLLTQHKIISLHSINLHTNFHFNVVANCMKDSLSYQKAAFSYHHVLLLRELTTEDSVCGQEEKHSKVYNFLCVFSSSSLLFSFNLLPLAVCLLALICLSTTYHTIAFSNVLYAKWKTFGVVLSIC